VREKRLSKRRGLGAAASCVLICDVARTKGAQMMRVERVSEGGAAPLARLAVFELDLRPERDLRHREVCLATSRTVGTRAEGRAVSG